MLVYSSFLFLIPVIISFYYEQFIYSFLLKILTLTSIIYHYTYDDVLKYTDMSIVMPLSIFLTFHSFYEYFYNVNNEFFLFAGTCGIISAVIFITNVKGSNFLHLFVHIFGALGYTIYSYALFYISK